MIHKYLNRMATAQTEQLQPLRKENSIMKANLKKILGTAALGLTLLVNTAPTWAGSKDLPEVQIGSPATWVEGSMAGARFSGDSKQYIGCTSTMSWAGPWTSCYAKDKTGTQIFLCNTGDPKYFEVTKAITDSSKLYITASSAFGTCTYISVDNSSSHLK